MPLVALLRHAEESGAGARGAPVFTRGRRGISSRGRAQAEAAARFLEPLDVGLVLASDARRAVDTAKIVGRGRPVEQVPALGGLELGEWEGRSVEEMPELPAVLADPARRPPGGESLEDVLARARPVLERALDGDGDAIVVSHRVPCAVLMADALGLPLRDCTLLQQDNAGINLIERSGAGSTVAMLNVVPLDPLHLGASVASVA
jgi:broad specificity phosphatase PhoE